MILALLLITEQLRKLYTFNMLFVAVDVSVLTVLVVVYAVPVHRASSSRRNFCHVETECISLFRYLSGLDDHPSEGQSLGLKNTSDSCVLYLDCTPKKNSFNCIFTAHIHINSFLHNILAMHCMIDLPFTNRRKPFSS